MAIDNAKEFVRYCVKNPEVVDKMKGFTQEELKQAVEELKNSGEVKNDDPFHHTTP